MIFVDSSVWIDYFNGRLTRQTELLDEFLGNELIVIGDIVLTEILQGFQDDQADHFMFRKVQFYAQRFIDF